MQRQVERALGKAIRKAARRGKLHELKLPLHSVYSKGDRTFWAAVVTPSFLRQWNTDALAFGLEWEAVVLPNPDPYAFCGITVDRPFLRSDPVEAKRGAP